MNEKRNEGVKSEQKRHCLEFRQSNQTNISFFRSFRNFKAIIHYAASRATVYRNRWREPLKCLVRQDI